MKNYTKEEWVDYYKQNNRAGYDVYLHDKLLEKYLPDKFEKICELGSGNGRLLKKMMEKFKAKGMGIEFSKELVKEANENGITTFESDILNLFNSGRKLTTDFDLVYSYGLIEHFDNPEELINKHLLLVKTGGYFFIQIPKFKGYNYWKLFFNKQLLKHHNLDIMEADILEKLCSLPNVKKIWCGNYGTFKTRNKFFISLLKLLFKDKGFETKWFSPCIMFIGQKI